MTEPIDDAMRLLIRIQRELPEAFALDYWTTWGFDQQQAAQLAAISRIRAGPTLT